MNANDYPAAPMVLGLVLGRTVEENFINSMIKSDDSLLPFVERPIAGVLAVLTVIAWLASWVIKGRAVHAGLAPTVQVKTDGRE